MAIYHAPSESECKTDHELKRQGDNFAHHTI